MSSAVTAHTLAITASAGRAQSALFRSTGEHIASHPQPADLLPSIQQLCADHGVGPHTIARLLIDVGPGSYTGLRTSITFARSLAALRQHQPDQPHLTIAAVTSFELMAARAEKTPTNLHILLDARRGRVHHGHVVVSNGRIALQRPPQAVLLTDVAKAIAAPSPERSGRTVWVSASCRDAVEAQLSADECATLPADIDLLPAMTDPRIQFVDTVADALEPLYLMGSYAGEAG